MTREERLSIPRFTISVGANFIKKHWNDLVAFGAEVETEKPFHMIIEFKDGGGLTGNLLFLDSNHSKLTARYIKILKHLNPYE